MQSSGSCTCADLRPPSWVIDGEGACQAEVGCGNLLEMSDEVPQKEIDEELRTGERAPAMAEMREQVPVADRMRAIAQAMSDAVAEMPAHADFLARHCRSPIAA